MGIVFNSKFVKIKRNMKKTLIYLMIYWLLWGVGINVYLEYIISRPMNGYIQLLTTIAALLLTVGLVSKTVKNLKTNTKTND
jgi:hypothetical protein